MNWLSLLIKLKGKPTNQVQWFPDFTIGKNILVTPCASVMSSEVSWISGSSDGLLSLNASSVSSMEFSFLFEQ